MIDIIIPCYNSHKTIDRCLALIVTQNIDCTVTLVNDGGKPYMLNYPLNLREIGYTENRGVGYTSNCGLEHTSDDLVMFLEFKEFIGSLGK